MYYYSLEDDYSKWSSNYNNLKDKQPEEKWNLHLVANSYTGSMVVHSGCTLELWDTHKPGFKPGSSQDGVISRWNFIFVSLASIKWNQDAVGSPHEAVSNAQSGPPGKGCLNLSIDLASNYFLYQSHFPQLLTCQRWGSKIENLYYDVGLVHMLLYVIHPREMVYQNSQNEAWLLPTK